LHSVRLRKLSGYSSAHHVDQHFLATKFAVPRSFSITMIEHVSIAIKHTSCTRDVIRCSWSTTAWGPSGYILDALLLAGLRSLSRTRDNAPGVAAYTGFSPHNHVDGELSRKSESMVHLLLQGNKIRITDP
jgi:hypothetical protein